MTKQPSKKQYFRVENFLQLPRPVLQKIFSLAIGLQDGELVENAAALRQAVILCRTSNAIRVLTSQAITSLNLPHTNVWPSVKSLYPIVWSNLESVKLTVDRSHLIPLLTWLSPAVALKHFGLTVAGAPDPNSRLTKLERHLLGKLFTSVGPRLETWRLHGLDNHALLMSGLFHCTSLRHIQFGPSAPGDEARTLISLTVLLALVNQPQLTHLSFPKEEWYSAMGTPPSAPSVAAACKITWNILWQSFTAGMKESAVNHPSAESDEKQIVSNFRAMSARLEAVNRDMQQRIERLANAAGKVASEDPPMALLRQELPKI